MTDGLAYLLNYLEDEFRTCSEVRVRPVARSGTRRAPDLEQDYDPQSSSIHARSGVIVQTRRKEFFFPEHWVAESSREQINQQVSVIRESLGFSE